MVSIQVVRFGFVHGHTYLCNYLQLVLDATVVFPVVQAFYKQDGIR